MASGNHFFSAAILLVQLVLASNYSFICPSYGISQDVLATICSQTQNQETCEKILESDPRTKSADLSLLSLISLELATKQATKTYNTFMGLQGNSSDPSLRRSLGKCVGLYQDMKRKLQADLRLSRQKQFKKITGLGQLTTLAYNCENGLPSDSPTAAITENTLLTIQSAIYVNEFVSHST
ncbi:hypothetical protein PTKIN_Ptkin06aG0220800 [Pterospermum kingtungense]